MIAETNHSGQVTRHLEQFGRSFGPDKVRAVLERTSLCFQGEHLASGTGADIGPGECTQYLEAVRALLGDIEYYPTRVNFILARCLCVERERW